MKRRTTTIDVYKRQVPTATVWSSCLPTVSLVNRATLEAIMAVSYTHLLSTLSFISFAALLVKVMASTWEG